MKSLHTLASQCGMALKAEYYRPYLEAEEIAVIEQAIHQKSQRYQWNLLRLLALKILTTLQTSALFRQEARLKTYSAQLETALLVSDDKLQNLRQALQCADALIDLAWRRRVSSPGSGVSAASPGSAWSASHDRQYETIRQSYLAHNHTLNTWHEQVEQLKDPWSQLTSPHSATRRPPAWKAVRREIPREFLAYQPSACQIRLSDPNIFRLAAAKEKRAVYQDLKAQRTQPPTPEKISENVQAAKLFLYYKAEAILHNAGALQRCILQETQQAIEHRCQVKLAHAEKIECLLGALEKIIQLLQSSLSPQKIEPSLSEMLTEAKTMKVALENSPGDVEAATLTQHLLTLDTHRQRFAQSITGGWMTLFSANLQARRRQEQQLNTALQSAIAQMTTPLYGFHEHAAVITPAQVKQQHIIAGQLAEPQARVAVEREKVEKIKNTFSQ